jgi:hypothetical protein
MKSSKFVVGAAMALLGSLAFAQPGGAMEVLGGASRALQQSDSFVSTVVVHRGAHVSRNVNRNVHVNRNVNVNRNVGYHGGVYRGAWVGRPYPWAPGGAIAAGAAIGVLAVGTAVAWAPPPPQPGLCWYYTDPSQRNGFWDTCQ